MPLPLGWIFLSAVLGGQNNLVGLAWVDKLAAGLGSVLILPMLGLRGDQAGPRVGSDFSEG